MVFSAPWASQSVDMESVADLVTADSIDDMQQRVPLLLVARGSFARLRRAVQHVIFQVLDSFISVHHNVGLKVIFLFACAEIVYMDKRLYSPCFLGQCYCAFNSLVHISSYF